MTGEYVRTVLKVNRTKMKDIAKSLGITPQHLNNMFKSPDIKVGTLEKIAKAAKLDIMVFFAVPADERQLYVQSYKKGKLVIPKINKATKGS